MAELQAVVPGELTAANERVCCDVIVGRAYLECQICKYVLDNPMLLSCCGQHLCGSCIDSIQHSNMYGVWSCPLCKVTGFTTLLNKGLLREINELKVHCPNRAAGCQWAGQLNQVEKHMGSKAGAEGECLCQLVKCKYPNCSSNLLRVNLRDHENEYCEFRQYTCKYCLSFTDTHQRVTSQHFPVCPDFPVPCPNECKCADMNRSTVAEHLKNECPLEEVTCDYQSAGCSLVRQRKSMSWHYTAAASYHSKLLIKQNASLQSKLAEQQQQLEKAIQRQTEQNTRFEELLRKQEVRHEQEVRCEQEARCEQEVRHEKRLSALEIKLAEIASEAKRNSSVIQKMPKDRMSEGAEVKESIILVENKFAAENSVMRNEVSVITAELFSLRDETRKQVSEVSSKCEAVNQKTRDLDNLSSALEALKMQQPNMVGSMVVQHIAPTLDVIEELRERLKVYESQVIGVRHDLSYVEKCMTPKPPYAFTVSRFTKRKFNKEVFVSPALYTHPRGYKLCIQVDVYGTNNDLSVYCCIMKGEHDDFLTWPFLGDIYLQIQNQLGDHHHYEKVISFDEATAENKCGRVTTGDKNYSHGLRFISHQELGLDRNRNCQYLSGDAVDFEVTKIDVKS